MRGHESRDTLTGVPRVRAPRLTIATADRVVQTLAPYVTAERKRRIEAVLATRTADVTVVLEDIYDPHNAAAVLRTAEGFGLTSVHVIARSTRFRVSRKVSQGAHKWLHLMHYADVAAAYAALRAAGYRVYAADVRPGASALPTISADRPVALVFGNEHGGLSAVARNASDGQFTVPMHGFVESLNISVACAVSLYDVLERRRQAGMLRPLDLSTRAHLRAAWYAASVRAAAALLAREGLDPPVLSDEPLTLSEDDR